MPTDWTLNGYALPASNVVPAVDSSHDGIGLKLQLDRDTRQDLGGMANFAGRLTEYQPPGEASLLVDGSPNGENLVALQVADRAADVANSGWFLWSSFSAAGAAGLADFLDCRADLRFIAGPDEAEGVCQASINLLTNDFFIGTSPE